MPRSTKKIVSESIDSLLVRRCVRQVREDETVVRSPLGVVDNGKKPRLILDLRYVNKHLATFKFKLEDLRTVAEVYNKGDFLVTFDLKSGYHHIAIAAEHHKYLGFSWQDDHGQEKFYVFCVLPFGLSSAPYVFTKVTRVLLRHWRAAGIKCQLYMDDGSGGHETETGAVQVATRMKADLIAAGFLPNEKKCRWEPSQVVELLGMVVDLQKGTVRATEKRVKKLMACVQWLLERKRPSARDLARLTGYLMSMSLALGPICRLRTRSFYSMIVGRETWSAPLSWSEEAKSDLEFWAVAFAQWHGQPFWSTQPRASVLSWSDASESGWGGYAMNVSGAKVARGEWAVEIREKNMSSTWRELRAIRLVLESLAVDLAGSVCTHRSDNQAAVHILQVGSSRAHLQAEAMGIFQTCMKHGIQLRAEWVPREENQLADYYSKIVDQDDWKVNTEIFDRINQCWGPHTLDCFASLRTKQLGRFCSRWWNPGCFAIDAFTVDWAEERVWLCPPLYLISRALDMLQSCQSHGTMIVPKWVSAAWWPKLFDGSGWRKCVKGVIVLPQGKETFVQGTCPYNLFGGKDHRCEVLALKLCMNAECSC